MINIFLANWFKGCYREQSGSTRDLNGSYYVDLGSNTIEVCMQFCRTNSYTYAGVQNGFLELIKKF